MAHMRIVVDRDAADIHLDELRFEGLELFGLAGERVVNAQHDRLFNEINTDAVFYPHLCLFALSGYFFFRAFSSSTRPKIMRPAAVCRTLVMLTSMYSPM